MPGASVWHRLGVWHPEALVDHCQPLDQLRRDPHPVEHRADPVVAQPVAYCWPFPLVASMRTVCHLAAVVAAASLVMLVASGSRVAAESVDEADTAVADSEGTDWHRHSIDSVFRELPVEHQAHRVDHSDGVRCGFPTVAGVPAEDTVHGTDLHLPAIRQDTSAVAVGRVGTVVDSSQSLDASLADWADLAGSSPVAVVVAAPLDIPGPGQW